MSAPPFSLSPFYRRQVTAVVGGVHSKPAIQQRVQRLHPPDRGEGPVGFAEHEQCPRMVSQLVLGYSVFCTVEAAGREVPAVDEPHFVAGCLVVSTMQVLTDA